LLLLIYAAACERLASLIKHEEEEEEKKNESEIYDDVYPCVVIFLLFIFVNFMFIHGIRCAH
jgi:hypothetical protein